MSIEPFGNLSDARISIGYRDDPRRHGTGLLRVPKIVLLEYPNVFIRLLKGSDIDAVFERLKAEHDENDLDAGC